MAKPDRVEPTVVARSRTMLASVSVNDFKSLHDVTVELGQFNVLIGANGSGKSNLLEAIGIIGAAASGRIDDQALLRRGIRPGVPAIYKSAFAKGKIANLIKISITSTQGSSYWINITNRIPSHGRVHGGSSSTRRSASPRARSPRGVRAERTSSVDG
jgi:ABC-type cobalamin/Fe3+-siderophores transport system ATPase subunit